MKEHLQEWYKAWLKDNENTDLIYVNRKRDGVYLSQVHFVRDTLFNLIWKNVKWEDIPSYSDRKITGYVVGEHTSKSVRLPVFLLEREDLGIKFVLRDNFYNWNVSVISEKPITTKLKGFVTDYKDCDKPIRPRSCWGYCFFEGFPEEYRFGCYNENNKQFSTYISSDYELYAFVRMIMDGFNDNS